MEGNRIYLVVLPEILKVTGAGDILRVGETIAPTKAKAVTQYLHRVAPTTAKIIAARLEKRRGLKAYAGEVPVIATGEGFDEHGNLINPRKASSAELDVRIFSYACALADMKGSDNPDAFMDEACRIDKRIQ